MARSRWAAVGAAVAVSLGAGGLGIARATAPGGASTYVPIVPCRLVDTRQASNVGPQVGPLIGPDVEITVDGWGDVVGDCNLPGGTAGLQLNVTAVDASELTNLRFYPEGSDTPTASNLNPAPGEPPTPNAVTVTLNAANGKFHVFNRFGAVDVVIDVAGYYTDHDHDDRYYPRAEADAAFATQAALDAAIATRTPRQQTMYLPASAFGGRSSTDPIARTSLLVYRSGGGYLDAPLTLPVGSRIVRVTAYFTDNNPSADLSFTIPRAYLGSSPASFPEEGFTTSGASSDGRNIVVTPDPPIEIAAGSTYSITAHSAAWTAALVIYGVRIDYTLPATASVPPILPPDITLPPVVSP